MRILFLTPYLPSPVRPRAYNFVKQLGRKHEVTLVSLSMGDPDEEATAKEMRGYCDDLRVLPVIRTRAAASCARRLLTPMPLQVAYTYCRPYIEAVRRIAESGSFDVVHAEHVRGAYLADGAPGVPRVYDSVDCITRLLGQRLRQTSGPLRMVFGLEELIKMRAYEPRVATTFDHTLVTSDRDKRWMERLIRRSARADRIPYDEIASGGVSVVRNGVDGDYFRPVAAETDSQTIVFSGRMSYFANVTAVLWFYNEVFPKLRQSRPGVKLKIVGSDPPPSIEGLARDPSVTVTGYVQDIRPHIASARMVICPMMVGVGIQNKVLEAMSMGKPVLATSLVCNGIPDARDGVHLLCADDADSMAEAARHLMDDPTAASAIGARASQMVRDKYTWEAAAASLLRIYEGVAETAVRGAGAAA